MKLDKEQIKIEVVNAKKKVISSGILGFDLSNLTKGKETTTWEQLSGKTLINLGLTAMDFGKDPEKELSKYPPLPQKHDLDMMFEKFAVIDQTSEKKNSH